MSKGMVAQLVLWTLGGTVCLISGSDPRGGAQKDSCLAFPSRFSAAGDTQSSKPLFDAILIRCLHVVMGTLD